MKSVENLRYFPPGEFGKILGLDRIPEAQVLREKISFLATKKAISWSAQLCSDWMLRGSDPVATFYVDGHVRVYYGTQTKFPRHYIQTSQSRGFRFDTIFSIDELPTCFGRNLLI
ncbi:MAG: hypothetical protein HQM08_27895 [Candidatus Riflebacteria bacterium]|nr:hypothetical protein [Candidatus Riflebacteria bacterium]